MKKILIIILMLFIISCDSENAIDCFQRTGDLVRQEVEVPDFSRILVNQNVEMVLKQGEQTSIVIETGDNLLNEVSAIVEGDRLVLSNTNDCNFVRDFNQTKIFVTAPNITEIRSASQFDISSDGILTYPELRLLSEDFNEDNGGNINGTFTLEVDCENIIVVGNNIASFFVTGRVINLRVGFFSGTGRFEGDKLIAENVDVFHRGTNKIIVNPRESITGEIRSTGDVISINQPPVVDVQEFFTGRLIFN
ncbi:head GIN domain-containing protein [uncultured Aquimarina sp.]|uniref:head GIN domain-containing protein n=1 Tax=uncultured Aquimarina sp. TaxID=575652 RepID=UPI0026226DB5|nr:head GIN domain-containing protein [uncultured Aquimarina sp.]